MIRAFIAVELPDETRHIVASRQDDLKRAMGRAEGGVRWSRPEGVHLTLQFLGNVHTNTIPRIEQAIRDACDGAKPARLSLEGAGAFPNLARPRVVWIGLSGDVSPLQTLQANISANLKTLGFEPDKPFQPHITLGRVR